MRCAKIHAAKRRAFAALGIAAGLPNAAPGQWNATVLQPLGGLISEVYAISPSGQYGTANLEGPGGSAPGYWSGSAASWTSLVPLGEGGAVRAVAGAQLAGEYNAHAAIWEGPSHTLVDLHPPNWSGSMIYATTGIRQAGVVASGLSPGRAAVWHGSAASVSILHPDGAFQSEATAADGEYQGGWVRFYRPNGTPAPEHAAIWSSTAQSFMDLNPAGTTWSKISGMGAGQLVGTVGPALGGTDAALWTSIGAPYIRLNPPGVIEASLTATCGSAQVGYMSHNLYGFTAAIWFGTPESFIPLSPCLPPEYYSSVATCVAEANGVFYVGGYAFRSGATDAILWVGVPEPASLTLLFGAALAVRRRRR